MRMIYRGLGGSVLALAVLLGLCVPPSGAASPVVTRTASLVPSLTRDGAEVGFVTGGRKALYTASWTNESNSTITNVTITVRLPAGSTLLSADPAVCSASVPADPAAPVVVTCPRDNLRSGATFTQQIFFRAPEVTVETRSEVTADLQGDERTSDPNREHSDTFAQDPKPLTIVPTAADAAGGCTQLGDPPLGTQSGLSATNPIITAASLTGPTGLFCTPVTLVEQHRTNPTEACGAGAECTTDISTTEAPAVSAPIQLTFTFVANNRNLTWYKNGAAVANCPGATQLPVGLDACVNSRAKVGSMAVALGVLWRGGPDPFWAG
jgi:uncharacterized repeat protein (TIGR01451 family)